MTDYISNINGETIGGKNFDNSTWTYPVVNGTSQIASVSLTGTHQTRTYDISGFFPDDACYYEITIEGNIGTGTTSGNGVDCWIYPSSSVTGTYYRLGRTVTRTSSNNISGGQVTVPIAPNDRHITLSSGDSTSGTATFSLYLKGIKRLGLNSVDGQNEYIEKISIPNKADTPIGGKQIGGRPEWSSSIRDIVGATTLTSNQIRQYSLANILPDDGCNYEVKVTSRGRTADANGSHIIIKIGSNTTSASAPPVCYRTCTRAAAIVDMGGNAIVPIGTNRIITIANNAGQTASNVGLWLESYRRLGTNSETGFLEQITTPNGTIPFGGTITTGEWVYKGHDVWAGKTFSATGETEYTVSNYLPNDGQDYEVMFWAYGRTGGTNGNAIYIWLRTSNSWGNTSVATYTNTRLAGNQMDERSGSFYVKNSTGTFKLYSNVTYLVGTSGNCGLRLIAYRRLGTNE